MVNTLEKELEFVNVNKIDKPGEYRFATNGNWDGKHSWTGVASNVIYDKHPRVKYDDIPNHLREKFQGIALQRFIPASLWDGEYTPSEFQFVNEWTSLDHDGNYVIYDGEIYRMSSGGQYSNGDGSWGFYIKDIGNLSIVKNKLIIDEPIGRDGEFKLTVDGSAPHHSTTQDYWRAWIDYKGEKPGKLVRGVIDYVNSEKKRMNIPLWLKQSSD